VDNPVNDPWLNIKLLCRFYKRGEHEVRALDGIDMSMNRGDFLAVVGSSGSGKSTLLNLIAGLDEPTSGHILFDNIDLNGMNRRQLATHRAHRVGIVFQSFNLFAHLDAVENVALALLFTGTPRSERRSRASAMLERLGLGDRLDHHPSDLSGGEQQRVAIARALVKKPDLLLADEPTGNLDQTNSAQIADLLTELNSEGLTIIMVTHDEAMARSHAHRTIRLHYGKVADGDAPTEETPR
jgi:putative ABC transport system ATP-binding protein